MEEAVEALVEAAVGAAGEAVRESLVGAASMAAGAAASMHASAPSHPHTSATEGTVMDKDRTEGQDGADISQGTWSRTDRHRRYGRDRA